jgi:hypothetical protein
MSKNIEQSATKRLEQAALITKVDKYSSIKDLVTELIKRGYNARLIYPPGDNDPGHIEITERIDVWIERDLTCPVVTLTNKRGTNGDRSKPYNTFKDLLKTLKEFVALEE